MKLTIRHWPLLCMFLFCAAACSAQTDSLQIKLQQYKKYYDAGLIDSQEYAGLKAKLLGIGPVIQYIEAPSGRKFKVMDSTIYYNPFDKDKMLPAGLYMSMEDLKSKKPSLRCAIVERRRNNYDYENGVGGNMMLLTEDGCIAKIKLKMDVWLYSNGLRCYINLDHFKMQPFYSQALTMGRFIGFYKNETSNTVEKANNWGGSIGSEIAMATGHDFKKLFVIDIANARLETVTHEYMLEILKPYPALHSQYDKEVNESNGIWIRYLQQVNDLK